MLIIRNGEQYRINRCGKEGQIQLGYWHLNIRQFLEHTRLGGSWHIDRCGKKGQRLESSFGNHVHGKEEIAVSC